MHFNFADIENMRKRAFIIFIVVFLCADLCTVFANDAVSSGNKTPSSSEGVLFAFKFSKGDSSRILSTVDEDVFVNGQLTHRAKIVNRISSNVTAVFEDGSGECNATFMTSETSVNQKGAGFSWGNEYTSIFTRDRRGRYTIDDIYFMPTVRDVPVFPEHPVKKGNGWVFEGHEAHDLRNTFNMQKPFKVPFMARYRYADDEVDEKTGRTLNLIEVEYDMYFESPKPSSLTGENVFLPAVTMGHSSQKILWDNERGMIDHYSEEFRIIIEDFSGVQYTFSGVAYAEVMETERISTNENIKRISESISGLGYDNVAVKTDDRGVTISIESIQFEADSSMLVKNEKEKIKKIAEILKGFPNDLLITGYCADRGTKQNQQRISEERAASVADYLSELGVRAPECIFVRGLGASSPVASNKTEEGRAKNRRVEITIIDN